MSTGVSTAMPTESRGSGRASGGPGGASAWLSFLGAPPLLVVSRAGAACRTLEAGARCRGFGALLDTDSARAAYAMALKTRPAAVLSDTLLADGGDEQLRAAVRNDFLLREVPLIVAPLAELAQRQALSAESGEPLLDAIASVLSPRGALLDELAEGGASMTAWVEPVGAGNLLRVLGAAGVSGRLTLDPEQGPALTATLAGGEVVRIEDGGVLVDDHALALVDLVGRRWRSCVFTRAPGVKAALPLRRSARVEAAIEQAQRQNNALVHRIFERGLGQDGLALDDRALSAWVGRQSDEARPLAEQVAAGAAPCSLDYAKHSGLLRALLHELRREAVLRVQSAALVVVSGEVAGSADRSLPTPGVLARKRRPARPSRAARALVVAAACLATLLLAGAGYYLLRR